MGGEFVLAEPRTAHAQSGTGPSAHLKWDGKVGQRLARALGEAQSYLDSEVLRACEPYVPFETGALVASGRGRGGEVQWGASYAAAQYYNTAQSRPGTALRGGRWFERMMADQGEELIKKTRAMGGVR